jgi:hypothetical protein
MVRRPTGSLRVASGGGAGTRLREDGGRGAAIAELARNRERGGRANDFSFSLVRRRGYGTIGVDSLCRLCAREDDTKLIRKLLASATTDMWALNIGVQ